MAWSAMKASLDVVHARQIDDPFNRGNPASIGDCDTDKINQLVFDQLVAIPDRIEDFKAFGICRMYLTVSQISVLG